MEDREMVVLVDAEDRAIGLMEKLQAHQEGRLHRALSVFLFNGEGEMLLQRRALSKYHSGGLWTNTCCSHPRENETPLEACTRRLMEEMGIVCPVKKIFDFIYRADLDKNLIEHELDHVFTGTFQGEPVLNQEEAMDWKWAGIEEIARDMAVNPGNYTTWFRMIYQRVFDSAQLS